MQYEKNKFLFGVHAKIQRKKKIRHGIYTSVSILSIFIISFFTTDLIYQSTMERLWNDSNSISYYYEWESMPEVHMDDIFEFIVDETDLYDVEIYLSDEFANLITLTNPKTKG